MQKWEELINDEQKQEMKNLLVGNKTTNLRGKYSQSDNRGRLIWKIKQSIYEQS